MPKGWLVNDNLTCIPGTKTLWHDLLEWIPDLEDMTGFPFPVLADEIEQRAVSRQTPDFIIRNATYFRKMNLSCKMISLLQDIVDNSMQREVLDTSDRIVVNSEYTLSRYPYLINDRRVTIIPLGIDFNLFHPIEDKEALRSKWGIRGDSVLFIGAVSDVKGWPDLVRIIERDSQLNYVLVLKDENPVHISTNNYQIFRRLNHKDLVEVINACNVGICTSITETQHLAGIEMGACGLPIVTTNVGSYYNREAGDWGCVYKDPLSAIYHMLSLELNNEPREYWLQKGFDKERCKNGWLEVCQNT